MALVDVEDLTVQFGGVTAVRNVTASFPAGQLTGLIGPNGAGKTTLIDALTGFVPATGRVVFGGHDLTSMPPYRRARHGLGRTWQSVELFPDLTVSENLEAGTRDHGLRAVLQDVLRPRRERAVAAAARAMDLVGIRGLGNQRPAELSYGERKLVGIARALMLEPAFLLLDEPGAGLDSAESLQLGARLRRIAESGVGLLLVDHDMGLVLGSCDYVHVLQFGEMIAEGLPEEIRGDQRVIAAYLGSPHDARLADQADSETYR